MKQSEFIKTVAAKTQCPQKNVNEILLAVARLARDDVMATGESKIPYIGKAKTVHVKERMGRNPSTGDPMLIPAKSSVKFKLTKNFMG